MGITHDDYATTYAAAYGTDTMTVTNTSSGTGYYTTTTTGAYPTIKWEAVDPEAKAWKKAEPEPKRALTLDEIVAEEARKCRGV